MIEGYLHPREIETLRISCHKTLFNRAIVCKNISGNYIEFRWLPFPLFLISRVFSFWSLISGVRYPVWAIWISCSQRLSNFWLSVYPIKVIRKPHHAHCKYIQLKTRNTSSFIAKRRKKRIIKKGIF